MTLLHQAAQKAVEVCDDSSTVQQIDAPDAGPIPEICDGMDKAAVWSYAHLCGYRAALQQQPEPVALAEMTARKDAAYEERNKVVAALAKVFPSGIARTAIEGWSEDWHGCVYIDLPTGQVSWHFQDSQAYLFDGLPPYTKPWDGHDTPEKYRRLSALQHQEEPSTAVIPPAPPECETEDEKTAFSFGYWQGLHAAREGQEVPREPVSDAAIFAIAGSLGWCRLIPEDYRRQMGVPEGARWSNTMTADDVLLFARALLASSPSTTRQQEVGSRYEFAGGFLLNRRTRGTTRWEQVSKEYENDPDVVKLYRAAAPSPLQQEVRSGWRPIESAPKDGREVILRKGKRVGAACWTKWPDQHDMDGALEVDGGEGWTVGYDGDEWADPTHWQPLPAAPSTPEKAGGVSDGVGACPGCGRFYPVHLPGCPHVVSASVSHPLPAQANDGGEQ